MHAKVEETLNKIHEMERTLTSNKKENEVFWVFSSVPREEESISYRSDIKTYVQCLIKTWLKMITKDKLTSCISGQRYVVQNFHKVQHSSTLKHCNSDLLSSPKETLSTKRLCL